MAKTKKSKGVHYVDNKEFLRAMVEFKEKCKVAKDNEEDQPPVTNYIGECFLKIATHLSYRPNFINYTYRDEMISDGIENCLLYAHNFNPEKSKNPFSYFTQIIHHSYIRRITKEKKQMHIKYRIIEEERLKEQLESTTEDNTNHSLAKQYKKYIDSHDKYAVNPQPKKRKKKSRLEHFMR